MDAFEYLAALMAVIVGLTIVHVLEGIGRILSDPGRYRLYWIHLLWAIWVLIYCVFYWWFEFALSRMEVWSFGHFAQVLLYAAVLYFIAVILFPRSAHFNGDFREHYFQRRGWLMAGFITANIIDVFDTLAKGTEHFAMLGLEYQLNIALHVVAGLAAWRWRSPWLHGTVIIAVIGWQLRLIYRLFGTLA